MSSSKERADLQRRLDGLESTIMSMAAHGLGVPDDLAEELAQVQSRLSEMGGAQEAKAWTSWLGTKIDEFVLLERLSSGTYSHVFRARNEGSGEECAFKIAATPAPIPLDKRDYLVKQIIRSKGAKLEFLEFSANDALEMEYKRLESDSSGAFVKVSSSGFTPDKHFYYRMPLLVGQSLKDLLVLQNDAILKTGFEILQKLAGVIEALSRTDSAYHGNLQPDNIFISKTDLVLLSPGVFHTGSTTNMLFTTPAYYPFFEPNDLTAIGFVLWELVCRQNPMAPSERQERPQIFTELIRGLLAQAKIEDAGPLQELLKFIAPRDLRKDLSNEAEVLLMKAIRIGTDPEGFLTITDGFGSAAEFAEALNIAEKQGMFRRF
jgi:serine/threonine protein kinase